MDVSDLDFESVGSEFEPRQGRTQVAVNRPPSPWLSLGYEVGNEVIDSEDQGKDKEIDFIDEFNERVYSLYRVDGNTLYLNMFGSEQSVRPKTVKDVFSIVFVKE